MSNILFQELHFLGWLHTKLDNRAFLKQFNYVKAIYCQFSSTFSLVTVLLWVMMRYHLPNMMARVTTTTMKVKMVQNSPADSPSPNLWWTVSVLFCSLSICMAGLTGGRTLWLPSHNILQTQQVRWIISQPFYVWGFWWNLLRIYIMTITGWKNM